MKPLNISLKLRLGLGAALLAAGAILAAGVLFIGMTRVADRLDTALAAEQRMSRYATVSTQVSTLLVVATEAVQSNLPPESRAQRLEPVVGNIKIAFGDLRLDLERAVKDAEHLGIDQQARYGTQSLGIARMEALLDSSIQGLNSDTSDPAQLRAHVDRFASAFDPLLNQAINAEVLFRAEILKGIQQLRRSLSRTAVAIALASIFIVIGFYIWLIRPQFRRLDQLREAAKQIGVEDFSLSLPETMNDEIGQLFRETNVTARSLAQRKADVQSEWARLNETIATRTQELQRANDKLAEIDQNRRRFFADVSHELRTPLTVILMEAQLGQRGATDPTEAFATIESRTARLNRRIDDLLRVAKSESGQLVFDPAPVSLRDVSTDVTEEVSAELESAGMTLSQDPFPDLHVMSDPNWLRQLVTSAIRNALRHARDGGVIHLGFTKTDKTAGLTVRDNGPGIPPPDQGKVFDRFAQSSNAADGFGIGLALAKWVVTELDGDIELKSPSVKPLGDNPGLEISIRMPVAKQ